MAATARLRSSWRGESGCWRANASSFWVRAAARRAPSSAVSTGRASRPGSGRLTRLDPPSDRVEVADHDGQKIVEIVGDAGGQLADELELLRLKQQGSRPEAAFRLRDQRGGLRLDLPDDRPARRHHGEGGERRADQAQEQEPEQDRLQPARRLLARGEQVDLGGVERREQVVQPARGTFRVAFRKLGVEGGRIGPPGGRSAVEDAEVGAASSPISSSRRSWAGLSATRRWSFASSSLSASRAPASSLAPRPSSRLSRTSISAFWRPMTARPTRPRT